MSAINKHCQACGMLLNHPAEFHPYEFCVLVKAGQDPRRLYADIAKHSSSNQGEAARLREAISEALILWDSLTTEGDLEGTIERMVQKLRDAIVLNAAKNMVDKWPDWKKAVYEPEARLREALAWYADKENYEFPECGDYQVHNPPVWDDGGEKAREALSQHTEDTGCEECGGKGYYPAEAGDVGYSGPGSHHMCLCNPEVDRLIGIQKVRELCDRQTNAGRAYVADFIAEAFGYIGITIPGITDGGTPNE
ncbi:hypothetical protein [Cohnella panacarvi]|uniref:hypothetical protein n=1 Tax=Cohnella panacarvi TaxID=400776 RepID=UPI000479D5DF|nr:hypothetical protein [Cohnella panacarvi]